MELKLRIDEALYTFSSDGKKLLAAEDKKESVVVYRCPQDIEGLKPVFNAPNCICVSTIAGTSYILSIKTKSTAFVREVIPALPHTVYHAANVFYYNCGSTVVRVEGGNRNVMQDWQVCGFDVRTNKLLIQEINEVKVYAILTNDDYDEFHHSSLESIRDILPTWITIIDSNFIVIVSKNNKVMCVNQRLITSYYVIDHSVSYLKYFDENSYLCSDFGLISCHSNEGFMTVLTLPVLGVYKNVDTVMCSDIATALTTSSISSDNPVITQLTETCHKQISDELQMITCLYSQYAEKLKFLNSIWEELCQENSTEKAKSLAKVQRKDLICDDSGFSLNLPYQLPVLPPFRTRTSFFQNNDGSFLVFCNTDQKLRNINNLHNAVVVKQCYEMETIEKHYTITVTNEWKKKLKRMFRSSLAQDSKNPIRTDNLAYLTLVTTKASKKQL